MRCGFRDLSVWVRDGKTIRIAVKTKTALAVSTRLFVLACISIVILTLVHGRLVCVL